MRKILLVSVLCALSLTAFSLCQTAVAADVKLFIDQQEISAGDSDSTVVINSAADRGKQLIVAGRAQQPILGWGADFSSIQSNPLTELPSSRRTLANGEKWDYFPFRIDHAGTGSITLTGWGTPWHGPDPLATWMRKIEVTD